MAVERYYWPSKGALHCTAIVSISISRDKIISNLTQPSPFKSAAAVVWLSMLGALVVNIQPMFLGAISEVYGFNAGSL